MLSTSSRLLLLTAILLPAGCTTPQPQGKSPLEPSTLPPDGVVLEVFRVRFPLNDAEINGQLWEEIDEQHFPAQLRRRLADNGFRVGLVGSPIPIALSRLLQIAGKPAPAAEANQVDVGQMNSQPQVERRRIQVRSGQRSEIFTSEIYDSLPVLLNESGQLCGQTYSQAQTLLASTASLQPDGRVELRLVPELYHDRQRQRWVPGQGSFRLEAGRPSRVFDELAVSAALSPGSMLLITNIPGRSGSLGHHFFTDRGGRPQQKLLILRIAQTNFIPPETLQLPP